MGHVRPALRAYNLSQLTAVEHPAADGVPAHSVSCCRPAMTDRQSLLSGATVEPGSEEDAERYVDGEGKRSFAFDHITLVRPAAERWDHMLISGRVRLPAVRAA